VYSLAAVVAFEGDIWLYYPFLFDYYCTSFMGEFGAILVTLLVGDVSPTLFPEGVLTLLSYESLGAAALLEYYLIPRF